MCQVLKCLTYINIFITHNTPVCYIDYLLLFFIPPYSYSFAM